MSKIGQIIVVDRILKKQSFVILLFSIIGVFAIYFQSLNFEFLINFDDDLIILNHPELHQFNLDNLKRILIEPLEGLYHPITSLSWMIDAHFFGLDPFYFHLQNVILHLINGVLLYFLITKLGFNRISANLGALLFLVHPMAVENVSWVSSRKDLLLGVFFLLSLISYIRYAEKSNVNRFLLLILFFLLALLSKVAAVVLPLLFLLIGWYRERKIVKRSFISLIPFFLIALFFGLWNIQIQSEAGYIREELQYSFIDRFFMISYGIKYYFIKFFVPTDLSPKNLYPVKEDGLLPIIYYLSILLNLTLVFALYYFKKLRPLLLFAFLFFFISILPILKIIPTGNDVVSNRYAYMAYVGFYAVIPFVLTKKNIGVFLLLGIAASFSIKTYQYQSIFKNSVEVWTEVIDSHENNNWGKAMALNERGQVKLKSGDRKGALSDINESLDIEPGLKRALMNRSVIYDQANQLDNALPDLNKVLEDNEDNVDALRLRGMIHGKKGNFTAALDDLNKAISLNSERYDLYINRGIVYSLNEQAEKALSDFNEAIRLGPDVMENYINRANLYFQIDSFDLAKKDLEKVYSNNQKIYRNNYLLAKVYFELDEKEKGLNILNKYAGNQLFASNIAQQLLAEGYVEESLPFFNIAIGDPQIRDKSLYQRSQAFAQLKDFQNAIDDLFAILENVPNPQFFFEIANYYQELEETEKACEFWGEASKRNYPPADIKIIEFCN